MKYEDSLALTISVLHKHLGDDRAIEPRHHIQSDLGLDSLGVMEVVADIEDELCVQIPSDALGGVSTVEDVAHALTKLTRGERA